MVLVADLKKAGESTWNRIWAVDRLSRRVTRSSAYLPGHPELLSAPALPPLYVNDAVLDTDAALHQGDVVVWLAFNDVSSDNVYRDDLQESERTGRPVLEILRRPIEYRAHAESASPWRTPTIRVIRR